MLIDSNLGERADIDLKFIFSRETVRESLIQAMDSLYNKNIFCTESP